MHFMKLKGWKENTQIAVEKLWIGGFLRRPISENLSILYLLPIFKSIKLSGISRPLLKI